MGEVMKTGSTPSSVGGEAFLAELGALIITSQRRKRYARW